MVTPEGIPAWVCMEGGRVHLLRSGEVNVLSRVSTWCGERVLFSACRLDADAIGETDCLSCLWEWVRAEQDALIELIGGDLRDREEGS